MLRLSSVNLTVAKMLIDQAQAFIDEAAPAAPDSASEQVINLLLDCAVKQLDR